MRFLYRILTIIIAIAFTASGIAQYHHHDDDGSICLRIHTDICSHKCDTKNNICYDHNEISSNEHNLNTTHHHCCIAECMPLLSESEPNTTNTPLNHISSHANLNLFFCAIINDLVFKPNLEITTLQRNYKQCIQEKNPIINGWSLRAPPYA